VTAGSPGPEAMSARRPQRRCVVCQQSADKLGLIRVRRSADGRIRLDPTGRAEGRGAYVCRRQACLGSPALAGRLARSLGLRLDATAQQALASELQGVTTDGASRSAMAGVDR